MRTSVVILLKIFNFQLNAQQATSVKLKNEEKKALLKAIENDAKFAEWVKDTTSAIKLYENYKAFTLTSDSTWKADQQQIQKSN